MAQAFELEAFSRDDQGKGASRRLRRVERKIPAIVYGGEGKSPKPITLWHNDLKKAIENEAFFTHIISLKIDGKKEDVIIKDLQRHPYKPILTHADFLRVEKGHKINVNVPIHFLNEESAPAIKLQGGSVYRETMEVEVTCLPDDLPEYIEVDLYEMELEQILHLSDLNVPKGVEIVALQQGEDHDHPVVAIHKPKGKKADQAGGEAAGEEGEEEEGGED
ncbi:large subunit ribosomal protein L25 [Halospina denitrificans]|uniref:Large ribosomal subunit protein bL25 n=1 Tax=Halospina denitrificans TaxID=332522 RepID=A0A4R7JKE6_9GAMM|nr:50S ribosomal protein L25/general stress protein Ctc [Halospina denitrificans]TDT38450.1 large subunit ribosomal protein L25 [Halospina denitrificans]